MSLSEILQARRRGKTSSNNDERNLRGVSNQGADDDVDDSQNGGQ